MLFDEQKQYLFIYYNLISIMFYNFIYSLNYFIYLERGDIPAKTTALKKVMYQLLNGEKMPSILMTIIRFVLPLQDHTIKKLLLIFWEIVPKTSSDGKLLQEMILVCDAYRKDLEHPNEFIRGSTLRFLCKLKVKIAILSIFCHRIKQFVKYYVFIQLRYYVIYIYVNIKRSLFV